MAIAFIAFLVVCIVGHIQNVMTTAGRFCFFLLASVTATVWNSCQATKISRRVLFTKWNFICRHFCFAFKAKRKHVHKLWNLPRPPAFPHPGSFSLWNTTAKLCWRKPIISPLLLAWILWPPYLWRLLAVMMTQPEIIKSVFICFAMATVFCCGMWITLPASLYPTPTSFGILLIGFKPKRWTAPPSCWQCACVICKWHGQGGQSKPKGSILHEV